MRACARVTGRDETRRDPAAPWRVAARFRDGAEEVELLIGSGGVRARDALGVAARSPPEPPARGGPAWQLLEEDELRRGSAAAGACCSCWNATAPSAGSGVGPVQKMELKGSSPSPSARGF
jgi:hypothetical protein